MTFEDKVVAITGAASGIGRALAFELASRGAEVALSDVDPEVEAVARQVAADHGHRVTVELFDVSDREAMHGWAERSIAEHGRVDAIVNNAGVSLTQTFQEMSYDDLEWLLGINLWGVIHGTKAFLPHLVDRRTGWVVNISSIFGMIGVPTQTAYNISKFGVRGLNEALRQELEGTGVAVISVHPGGVNTNIVRRGRFYRDLRGRTNKERAVRAFEKGARTSPEDAAKIIVRGMEKRSPRVLVGADAKVIDGIARSLPASYDRAIGALLKVIGGGD